MVTFLCRNCRFRFTPKTGRTEAPAKCGNCGGNGTVEKVPDANQIIMDSNLGFD